MSDYPTGISPAKLDEVIRRVESGENLISALWRTLEESSGLTNRQLVETNSVYWYLFDRLPTAEAQHLWVLRKNLEIARMRESGVYLSLRRTQ